MNARLWSRSPSTQRRRAVLAVGVALTMGGYGLSVTPSARAAPPGTETVGSPQQSITLGQEYGSGAPALPTSTALTVPVALTGNADDLEGLDPTFPIETRIVISPDQLEVKVGDTPYDQPPEDPWLCTSGVWVLALGWESLEPPDPTLPDGKDMPLCNNNDAKALGTYFGTLKHDLVIVNSLYYNGSTNTGDPLPSLPGAMEELGAAPETSPPASPVQVKSASSAPADFPPNVDGMYFKAHVFSLVGELGLAPGTRDLGWGDASADDVPAGSESAASIDGTLVEDADSDFELVHQERVLYDVAPDSTVTVGDQIYPGRSVGSGGGFHVVAIDRQTLKPLLDESFDTSGDNGVQQSAEMVDKLSSLNSPDVLFFIASYGDPASDDPGLNYTDHGALYYGLPERVFDWLVYLGATPGALTDLVAHPRYALVGSVGGTYEQPEAFQSAEASTAVAEQEYLGADVIATGELQGVLGIGNTNMWYGSIMDNAPLVFTVNHEAHAPTLANFGLANLIANTTAPWPYTSDPSDPDHTGYLAAYAAISDMLCSGCNHDIRYYYASSSVIGTWASEVNTWQEEIENGRDPYTPNAAYTKGEFDTMVDEIGQELGYVSAVDGEEGVMDSVLTQSDIGGNAELQTAYNTVKKSLSVPPTDHVLSIVFDVFKELVTQVPEVGEVVGLAMSLGQDAAELAAPSLTEGGEDAGPAGALTVTADNLAEQAAKAFDNDKKAVDQDFDQILANYGKLSTYADKIKNEPSWTLSGHEDKVEHAMTIAAEISYFKSLLPVNYYIVHGTAMKLGTSNESQAPDVANWCWANSKASNSSQGSNSGDYCAAGWNGLTYDYGTSAYAFPNGRINTQTPGWDVMILGQSVRGALEPVPIPDSVIVAINSLGVAPSDVLLRWPLDRYYCPVGSSRLCVVGND